MGHNTGLYFTPVTFQFALGIIFIESMIILREILRYYIKLDHYHQFAIYFCQLKKLSEYDPAVVKKSAKVQVNQ